MTKKDYIKFAAVFRNNRPSPTFIPAYVLWAKLLSDIAIIFAEDNPNFDVDRFCAACMKED